MTKTKIGFAGVVAATCLGLVVAGCQKQPSGETATQPAGERAGPKTLTIWWAQWAPADGLQALAEEFGRKENVTVKVHQIPWSSFQDQVFQEFGKPATAFDVVVGDSQWLGRGATKKPLRRPHRLAAGRGGPEGPAPARAQVPRRVPDRERPLLRRPRRDRRDGLGLPQGLVRRSGGEGGVQEEVQARARRSGDLGRPQDHLGVLHAAGQEAIRQRAGHGAWLRRHRDGLRAAAVRLRRRVGRPEDA